MNKMAKGLHLYEFSEDVSLTVRTIIAKYVCQIDELNLDPDLGRQRDSLVTPALLERTVTSEELDKLKYAVKGRMNQLPFASMLAAAFTPSARRQADHQVVVARTVQVAIALAEKGEAYADDILIACRRAKMLPIQRKKLATLDRHFPSFDQPLADVIDDLESLRQNHVQKLASFDDRLIRWIGALRKAVEDIDKRTIKSPGTGLQVPGCVSERAAESDPEVSIGLAVPAVDTIRPNSRDETQFDRSKAGALLRIQATSTPDDRSDGVCYFRGQQVRDRLEMEAAQPTSSPTRLTRNEAWRAFGLAWKRAGTSDGDLLVALSVITGRRIDRLVDLPVVNGRLTGGESECWFHRNETVALWYRPELPQFESLMALGLIEVSSDEGLALPIPLPLADRLLRCLAEKDRGELKREAADAIRQLAKEVDKRVTGPRLSWRMPHRLTALGVDDVESAWLCGIAPEHCAGMYYSVLPRHRLIETYYAYVDELLHAAGAPDSWPDRPPLPEGVVGSRLRIKDEHVTRFFALEAKALTQARSRRGSVDAREYHNRYTLYTYELLAFASGIRSITEPFGESADLNRSSGTLRLSDKVNRHEDSGDRLISLGKIALAQAAAYDEHLVQLRATFRNTAPAISSHIASILQGRAPWLCCFDRKGKVRAVRPQWIGKALASTWPLPVNWSRHFNSDWLRQQGFGRGAIRAYFGHADCGAPPLSRFDGASVYEGIQIGEAINRRMRDLGIKAVGGWNTRA